ncbi:MAG: glycosyltransferase [Candidatus Electryoneaceae bacterium]|nr:glycosyltransferase [Candidatus Electryoneaceae bacterium]
MIKTVLVAPLDWGLGHATRCVPIIRALRQRDLNVVIASEGRSLKLLKREFPALTALELPVYGIRYPKKGSMAGVMLRQLPKILWTVVQEHRALAAIIHRYDIDAVISDNRFGLWTKTVPCVYITHQIMIMVPNWLKMIEPILHLLHRWVINRYDECWIPDYEDEPNISGDLSHKYPLPGNACYIGPLSRFKRIDDAEKKWDLLAILSGPEPQRTVFERELLSQVERLPGQPVKTLIVQGITEKRETQQLSDGITVVSSMTADELNREMASAEVVLMRAGYCGLMDLAVMGKKAILVPTPGQTEHEYLARYFHRQKIFYSESPDRFDLERALSRVKDYSGILMATNDLLESRLDAFVHV